MEGLLFRVVRAMPKRAAEGELDALVALVMLRRELDEQITLAARASAEFGYTWQAIGDAAGVSRQAAHRRWGTDRKVQNDEQ